MKRRRTATSMAQTLTVSRLESLPDPIVFAIFDLLPDPADHNSLSLSSSALLRLTSLHRRSLRPLRLLPPLLRRFPSLRRLDLSLLPMPLPVAPNLLAAAAFLCPDLVDLDLSGAVALSDAAVAALVRFTRLERLRLAGCRSISDVGIGHVAVGCAGLMELCLKGCVGVTDLGVGLLAVKCLKLRSLDLSYMPITHKCLPAVLSLQHLEELSLEGCLGINDRGLTNIEHENRSLKTLSLSSCQPTLSGLSFLPNASVNLYQLHLSQCFLISESLANNLQNLSNLQSIKLDGCQVTPLCLKTIATSSIQLRELSLRKCPGITDEGLCFLVAKHKELTKLDVTCCRDLTHVSVAGITASCSSLTSLSMESCTLISKDAFLLIGRRCLHLEELDLTDTELDDEGLIAISRCMKLSTLKIGICMNISDKGLVQVGKHCKELKELDLYRSIGVTDEGVMAIALGCPNLQIINVAYCNEVTDNALQSLSGCSELTTLEMRGCPQITSIGISAIASGCKLLSKIDIKKCHNIDDAGILSLARLSRNLRQINLSYCSITDAGLLALTSISCLQYIDALHVRGLTLSGLIATLISCGRLVKVKLHSSFKSMLPQHLLKHLQARGCHFQWKDKSFEVKVKCSKIWKQELQNVRVVY